MKTAARLQTTALGLVAILSYCLALKCYECNACDKNSSTEANVVKCSGGFKECGKYVTEIKDGAVTYSLVTKKCSSIEETCNQITEESDFQTKIDEWKKRLHLTNPDLKPETQCNFCKGDKCNSSTMKSPSEVFMFAMAVLTVYLAMNGQ